MKKRIFALWLTTMIFFNPINVRAINEKADNNVNESVSDSIILESDSILFNYSVDNVFVYTNNTFEHRYENEAFRFYPKKDGKYVVGTGKYNVDVSEIAEQHDLPDVSMIMQVYLIEIIDGVISVTKDRDYYFPPVNYSDEIQEADKAHNQLINVVEHEINSDHFFRFTIVRGYEELYSGPCLYLNSSSPDRVIQTNGPISFKLAPAKDSSSNNKKRYILDSSANYPEFERGSYKYNITLSKKDNTELTIYRIEENYGILDPSSLSIATYKQGDVNGDNEINVSDLLLLQKWLLGTGDTDYIIWQAADICEDFKINVFDFVQLKHQYMDTQKAINRPANKSQALN